MGKTILFQGSNYIVWSVWRLYQVQEQSSDWFFYQKLYKQRDIREPNSDSSPQKSNPPTTLNNPNLYFLSAVIMGVKPRDIYNLFTEKNSYNIAWVS